MYLRIVFPVTTATVLKNLQTLRLFANDLACGPGSLATFLLNLLAASDLKSSPGYSFLHGWLVVVPATLFAVLSAGLEKRNRFASYLSEWFASFLALFW
jgi:hypothetical protein